MVGVMVIVMGLVMPVLVIGLDGLPACGCAVVGIDGGCAAVPEAPAAEVPAAVMGESAEGAESLEQPATRDPRIERNANV
jgi:hypothetical protein